MEKQERAYVAWLNHWLSTEGEQPCTDNDQAGTLAARRLMATMRGTIWQQCRNSEELADVIYKIEKRIDEGRLKFRDVRRWFSGCGGIAGVQLTSLFVVCRMQCRTCRWLRGG
jgi:hypothetical protein